MSGVGVREGGREVLEEGRRHQPLAMGWGDLRSYGKDFDVTPRALGTH